MASLRRISAPQCEWNPITRHGDGFHPPQYIADEILANVHNYGVNVIRDGESVIFYHSLRHGACRVSFEITKALNSRLGLRLVPGWYYVSNGGNPENLNQALVTGMEFKLIP